MSVVSLGKGLALCDPSRRPLNASLRKQHLLVQRKHDLNDQKNQAPHLRNFLRNTLTFPRYENFSKHKFIQLIYKMWTWAESDRRLYNANVA